MRIIGKLALCAVVLGSVTACVPDDAPIYITEVSALTGDASACTLSEAGLVRGSLDVSSGQNFAAGVRLRSQLGPVQEQGALPSTERTAPSPNDAIFDIIRYEYVSTPSLGLTAESEPIYGVVAAGEVDQFVGVPFFGQKALESLAGSVVPGDVVTVHVGLQFEGRLRSGGEIRTNRVDFPVVLFNSGFQGCPAGQGVALNGACGSPGGTNGVPLGCCPIEALNCLKQ